MADVTADFTADLNWSSVSGAVDTTNKKSVIDGLDTAEGVSGTHGLYVPKASGDDSVGVCPNATSLADVDENCTGLDIKTEVDSDVSVVSEGGQDYWKVDGLTGTGGFSFVYDELYPQAEDVDDDAGEDDDEEGDIQQLDETGQAVFAGVVLGGISLFSGFALAKKKNNRAN